MQNVFGFTKEEINSRSRDELLLSMEIEFGSRCNLRCVYCYTGDNLFREYELELEEMFDVISQAKALGAKKIIYLGAGEPLLDSKLVDVIKYVHKLGLDHILFTNGTLINGQLARLFYEHKVTPVVKYKTQDPDIYDKLTGVPGSYASMKRGLDFLFKAGYPDKDHKLGIEGVICRQNINEIFNLWRWARNRGIFPYFECITQAGCAANKTDIIPEKHEIKRIFKELSRIDKEEYGHEWTAKPPIAGFTCNRHLYSCVVTSQGYVMPCIGVDIKIGNIREDKLKNILIYSNVRDELVNIKTNIKGPCRTCENNSECYGCRGNAYNITGDYLAADPTCWKHGDTVSRCHGVTVSRKKTPGLPGPLA